MQAVVGIFSGIPDARRAGQNLLRVLPAARVRVVSPNASTGEIDTLPVDDAEQPGMGAAVGGVVGGALGAALASLVAPPVGAAALAGIAGGALLGAGGGAVGGDALEEKLSFGVPHDEMLVYQEAVRRGHPLVVATVETEEESDAARETLRTSGALSVDAARGDWSVGLHDPQR